MRDAQSNPAPLAAGAGHRFAVIISRFNESVTGRLREGAVAAFSEAGVAPDGVEQFWVPGAFELPQAARAVADTGRFDAVVCLGCVIRGETPHFEYISSAVAHGLMQASGDTGVPMAFGVLTTDTLEQARQRSGDDGSNKGFEAAAAALEMAALVGRLRPGDRR